MSIKTIFTPQESSVWDFLKAKKTYRIPDFQRSYTWDTEKTIDFIDSVSKATKSNQLFLGTIYYHKKDCFYSITDGQQRIVTLFLTLNALRLLGDKKLSSYLYDSDEQSYIDIYEAVPLHNMLFKISTISELDNIKDSLDEITLTKLQIIDNQIKIYEHLVENKELRSLFMEGVKHSYFILIDVPNEKSVYRIFRNINSKGSPLTDIDIIKNAFFEVIPSNKSISTEKQTKYVKWKGIENFLLTDRRELDADLVKARKTLESNMTTTLNWYLSLKLNKVIASSDFRLATEYEKYLGKTGVDPTNTIKQLHEFSDTASFVLFPTQKHPPQKIPKIIQPYLIMLYNIELKQHIPIFLSLYYRIIKQKKFQQTENEIVRFCDRFYIFHFAFTTLLSDRGSKIGKKYARQALDIFNNDVLDFKTVEDFHNVNFYNQQTIYSGIDKRLFYLKNKPNRVKKINEMLKEYRFYTGAEQIRDFLTFIEYKLHSNEVLISGINIETIEHVYDADLGYHNMDNFKLMSFLPLESKLNCRCEGLTFDQKIPIYDESKYLVTKKFVETYWNALIKTPENIRNVWRKYLYEVINESFINN
jgi:uncharacterized protein with ParB-like and HNH nuclease domain